MLGQGMRPRGYHPIVDQASEEELVAFLDRVRRSIVAIVGQQPAHDAFLHQLLRQPAAAPG
jgi:tryptophan halogenase